MPKRLYLIGGSSASGKTTTARMLRAELRTGWLQADTIWKAIAATQPEGSSIRIALEVDEAIRQGTQSPEQLLNQHVWASAAICPALKAAIFFELRTTYDTLVVDGAWLLPSWMATLRFDDLEVDVRSVILNEPDGLEVKRAMLARSGVEATLPRQRLGGLVSSMYGDWLRDEAAAHGVPVVEARPRETLLARVKVALGVEAADGGPPP